MKKDVKHPVREKCRVCLALTPLASEVCQTCVYKSLRPPGNKSRATKTCLLGAHHSWGPAHGSLTLAGGGIWPPASHPFSLELASSAHRPTAPVPGAPSSPQPATPWQCKAQRAHTAHQRGPQRPSPHRTHPIILGSPRLGTHAAHTRQRPSIHQSPCHREL